MKNPVITVPVKTLEENAMVIHSHLGDGTLGDTKFEAFFFPHDMSIGVQVGKKRKYVNSQDIITLLVKAIEQEETGNQ